MTQPSASTQPASTQPSAAILKEIDALITQLGDDTWKVRQQAQDKLVEIGEDAYGRLSEALKTAGDEETRSGVRAAMGRIEENRISGPSLITLHYADADPKDIFASVARQAHTEFRLYPPNLWQQHEWPKVSIDADRASFWKVLKELSDKTGVSPQYGYGSNDRRMALVQAGGVNWLGAPSVVAGPFLITAQTIHRSNTINLLQPQAVQHQFNIQFMAYSEPKLRIMQYSSNVKLDEVTDDKGNSLMPQAAQYENISSGSSWAWNLYAQLQYPENAGTRITRFKGSARFIIQSKAESIEIPDIMAASNVVKNAGGHKYMLKQVRKQGDQVYNVTVVLYRDGRTPQEWANLQNSLYQGVGVQIVDDKGHSYNFNNTNGSSNSGESIEVTYQFTRVDNGDGVRLGEPAKLVWEVPTESKPVSIPFEFGDLPVP